MYDASRCSPLGLPHEANARACTRAQVSLQGSTAWATRGGGAGEARGTGVASDAAGAALVVGTFQGRATFGAEMLDASTGDRDAFVLKVRAALTTVIPLKLPERSRH